jgi:hypothetical protein
VPLPDIARAVEGEIAPDPEDPPDRPWPWGLMPPEGFPPPAVGMLSTYWDTAEFPGGELWVFATAPAGTAPESTSARPAAPIMGRTVIVLIA